MHFKTKKQNKLPPSDVHALSQIELECEKNTSDRRNLISRSRDF